jgi:hypothetical protein
MANKNLLVSGNSHIIFALVVILMVACGERQREEMLLPIPSLTAEQDQDAGTDIAPDSLNHGTDTIDRSEVFISPNDPHGSACEVGDTCLGEYCIEDADFPGGYCTYVDCAEASDCGEDAICVEGFGGTFCAPTCTSVDNCREDYACLQWTDGAEEACLPESLFGEIELPGTVDGDPCVNSADCRGGYCLSDAEGWSDGYCTTLECANFEDCASDGEDNRCLIQEQWGGTNFCVRICVSDDECRLGYDCSMIGGGLGYCAPNYRIPLDVSQDDYPFPIECVPLEGGEASIEYMIHEDTIAYMIIPFSPTGGFIEPDEIELPDGDEINFQGENEFQLTGSLLFGSINPIVVPAIEDFEDQLQEGEHRLIIEAEDEEICYYLLEEEDLGDEIDFNIYLVDVPGVDADSAEDDDNIQSMLDYVEEVYEQSDIELGEVNFYEVDGTAEALYGVLTSEWDIFQLVQESVIPEGDLDDVLSANVFFVQAMDIEGSGAIGVSAGLPGPAALHGTQASGVVFTSEFLGDEVWGGEDDVDGNEYTANVFAHEVGHYLGLFHTSEQFGNGYDPIDDTPECSGSSFPNNCDDINNLMFPYAGIENRELTEGQSWVLQVNPLTKD